VYRCEVNVHEFLKAESGAFAVTQRRSTRGIRRHLTKPLESRTDSDPHTHEDSSPNAQSSH
jgi:hypothetical protein